MIQWTADNYLMHHGIKGQKWGVRRFQNPDGTWTAEGKLRYRNRKSSKSTGVDSMVKKMMLNRKRGADHTEDLEFLRKLESEDYNTYTDVVMKLADTSGIKDKKEKAALECRIMTGTFGPSGYWNALYQGSMERMWQLAGDYLSDRPVDSEAKKVFDRLGNADGAMLDQWAIGEPDSDEFKKASKEYHDADNSLREFVLNRLGYEVTDETRRNVKYVIWQAD